MWATPSFGKAEPIVREDVVHSSRQGLGPLPCLFRRHASQTSFKGDAPCGLVVGRHLPDGALKPRGSYQPPSQDEDEDKGAVANQVVHPGLQRAIEATKHYLAETGRQTLFEKEKAILLDECSTRPESQGSESTEASVTGWNWDFAMKPTTFALRDCCLTTRSLTEDQQASKQPELGRRHSAPHPHHALQTALVPAGLLRRRAGEFRHLRAGSTPAGQHSKALTEAPVVQAADPPVTNKLRNSKPDY